MTLLREMTVADDESAQQPNMEDQRNRNEMASSVDEFSNDTAGREDIEGFKTVESKRSGRRPKTNIAVQGDNTAVTGGLKKSVTSAKPYSCVAAADVDAGDFRDGQLHQRDRDFAGRQRGANRGKPGGTGGDRQNFRKKPEVKVGTRSQTTETGSLKTVIPESHIHIYRLDPATSADSVSRYVREELKIHVVGCEKLQGRNSERYSSFKLTVRRNNEENVLDPKNWPEGVHLKKFFLGRQLQSRGS